MFHLFQGHLFHAATANEPIVFCVLVTSIFPCLFVTDIVTASEKPESGVNSSPNIFILRAGSELGLAENETPDGVVTVADVVEEHYS